MLNHPVNKDAEAATMGELRQMFGQALVAARPLPAGTVLALADLATRKPLAGIPAGEFSRVVGSRTVREIRAGEFLQFADIKS
jgi:sialic acid synthase SpsE